MRLQMIGKPSRCAAGVAATLFSLACAFPLQSAALAQAPAAGEVVTKKTCIQAESDRTYFNVSKLAGGVNRFYHYRTITPNDSSVPFPEPLRVL